MLACPLAGGGGRGGELAHRHSAACVPCLPARPPQARRPKSSPAAGTGARSPAEPARLGLSRCQRAPQTWPPSAQQGPFVIYLDEYWPYFLGIDVWEYALLEGWRVGGAPSTVSSSGAEQPASSLLSIGASPSMLGRYFQAFSLYQTWPIQNGIFRRHLSPFRHKNQVMILFFWKRLLARFFETTNVPDSKIILQNQKSTDICNETTQWFFS